MQSLMSIQNALFPECLITYFTAIWSLTTVYALMFYHMTLVTLCLITHITYIRALTNCVCVDVLSDFSAN